MQTFLPFPTLYESAVALDNRRLGKQRVEVLQILKALTCEQYGWKNHPAVKMWKGHEPYLALYGLIVCNEWIERGFRDTCYDKIHVFTDFLRDKPKWLGDKRLHSSHRAALLAKDPDWYAQFNWTEKPEIKYFWPV